MLPRSFRECCGPMNVGMGDYATPPPPQAQKHACACWGVFRPERGKRGRWLRQLAREDAGLLGAPSLPKATFEFEQRFSPPLVFKGLFPTQVAGQPRRRAHDPAANALPVLDWGWAGGPRPVLLFVIGVGFLAYFGPTRWLQRGREKGRHAGSERPDPVTKSGEGNARIARRRFRGGDHRDRKKAPHRAAPQTGTSAQGSAAMGGRVKPTEKVAPADSRPNPAPDDEVHFQPLRFPENMICSSRAPPERWPFEGRFSGVALNWSKGPRGAPKSCAGANPWLKDRAYRFGNSPAARPKNWGHNRGGLQAGPPSPKGGFFFAVIMEQESHGSDRSRPMRKTRPTMSSMRRMWRPEGVCAGPVLAKRSAPQRPTRPPTSKKPGGWGRFFWAVVIQCGWPRPTTKNYPKTHWVMIPRRFRLTKK